MGWIAIFPIIACVVFATYVATAIRVCGVFPPSLSETFYFWNFVRKGLGYIFTGMMFTCAFMLVPAWIEVTEALNPNFTFLPFLACASICFVGAAPAFKSDMLEKRVHTISAIWAAFCALLWCFVVCSDIWYLTLGSIATVLYLGFCLDRDTFKENITFWLEMCAFCTTFGVTITKALQLS